MALNIVLQSLNKQSTVVKAVAFLVFSVLNAF